MDVSARLTGKVAFITGAARGQGRAHALRLANEGADILALDLAGPLPQGVPYESSTPDDLAETTRQVEALDRRILSHQGDVRDFEDMQAFVGRGVTEHQESLKLSLKKCTETESPKRLTSFEIHGKFPRDQ